jgi:predicted nucleotidyltransferase component of viral defense system
MNLSLDFLDRCAAETGYLPTPLEKVTKLGDMAADIARHPLLKKSLTLKGGTALNLCFGAPRRLSVDLDYNYSGFSEREKMLQDRQSVESAVIDMAKRKGYRIQLSADTFAGRKIYLTYRSAFGQDERIEVDLNFLFRVPLGITQDLSLWQPGGLDQPLVRVVSMEELLAGKLLALLDRSAPRDVWDAANLPEMAGTVIESPAFRALFIAFSITLEHPLKTYNKRHLRRCIEANGIARQLLPMLMTGIKFTPDELIDKAWDAVQSLVIVNRIESEFLSSVESGTLLPNLLFPNDSELAGRIASHPALLWKIANIRAHKNLPDKIS